MQNYFVVTILVLLPFFVEGSDLKPCAGSLGGVSSSNPSVPAIQLLWTAYNADPNKDATALVAGITPLTSRLAFKIFKRVPKGKVDLESLFREAEFGLAAAIRDYIPEKGSFKSYAVIRMNGALLDYLRSLSRVPRNVLRSQKKILAFETRFQSEFGRPASDAEVRSMLNEGLVGSSEEREKEVDEILESRRFSASDSSLDALPFSLNDVSTHSPSEAFDRESFWEHVRVLLPPYLHLLVIMKFREGKPNVEIAKVYRVSQFKIADWLKMILSALQAHFKRYPEEAAILLDSH